MPAPFCDNLAVYKYVQVDQSDRKQHWTGYLQDEASHEVLWCCQPPVITHYGPAAEGPHPELYSLDHLACDRRAGELVVDAMRRLLRNGKASFDIKAGATKTATTAAIAAIRKYYGNTAVKPRSLDWLYWLEDRMAESRPKKSCKCGVDGCAG